MDERIQIQEKEIETLNAVLNDDCTSEIYGSLVTMLARRESHLAFLRRRKQEYMVEAAKNLAESMQAGL